MMSEDIKAFRWEGVVDGQLQIVIVFAKDVEAAQKIYNKCAGESIKDVIKVVDMEHLFGRLTDGMQAVTQMLLSRYTIEEAENGRIARMYKFSPKQLLLILGHNTRPKVKKINLNKLISGL